MPILLRIVVLIVLLAVVLTLFQRRVDMGHVPYGFVGLVLVVFLLWWVFGGRL